MQNFFGHITDSDRISASKADAFPTVSYATNRCELIRLENMEFFYSPFPFATLRQVFDPEYFDRLCETFPDEHHMSQYDGLGNKLLLSEQSNAHAYYDFMERHPEWKQLYQVVKSPIFVDYVLTTLCKHHIDLNCKDLPILTSGNQAEVHEGLIGRLEFSSMPAHGGTHRPHTDLPQKLVSIIISMTRDQDWNPDFGGETVICAPRNPKDSFNLVDRYLEFEQMELIRTLPFMENAGGIIVKTHNSWHGVMSTRAPLGATQRRRTIVIQIYKVQPSGVV